MISIPNLSESSVSLILFVVSVGYNVYQGIVNARLASKQGRAADNETQDAALKIVTQRESIFQSRIAEQDKDLEVKRRIIEQKDIQLAALTKQVENNQKIIENRSPQFDNFIESQVKTNQNISDVVLFFKDYIERNDKRMELVVASQSQHTAARSEERRVGKEC